MGQSSQADCSLERRDGRSGLREQVEKLEHALKQGETVERPVEHIFSPGIYARKMTLQAGDVIVSKIHRDWDLNILAKGKISFTTDEGVFTVEAPYEVVSPPGAKRAGYAHTEVVWITIHPNPTNERDPVKLEELFISPSWEAFLEQRCVHGLE